MIIKTDVGNNCAISKRYSPIFFPCVKSARWCIILLFITFFWNGKFYAQNGHNTDPFDSIITLEKISAQNEKDEGLKFTKYINVAHSYIWDKFLPDSVIVYLHFIENNFELNNERMIDIQNEYIDLFLELDPVLAADYQNIVKSILLTEEESLPTIYPIDYYYNEARLQAAFGNFESAIKNTKKIFEYAHLDTSHSIQNEIAYNYCNLANHYVSNLDSTAALSYADSCINYYTRINSRYIPYAYAVKASILSDFELYEPSIKVSEKVMNQLNNTSYVAGTYVKSNYLLGRYHKAQNFALDILQNANSNSSLTSQDLYDISYYGQKSAEKTGDKNKLKLLLDYQLEVFDIIQSTKDESKQLLKFFREDAKKDQEEIITQQNQLIENEKKRRRGLFAFLTIMFLAALTILGLALGLRSQLNLATKNKKLITSEQQKSEELLLNILPADIATELKSNGSVEGKLLENVSVLFTDFEEFSSKVNTLSPSELVNELNVYFTAFDHIIGKYGIEKIKTTSDIYLAAGGVPTAHPQHAQNIINAAIEICNTTKAINLHKKKSGLPYFNVRVGIHTGPVVAGIIGVKKFAYDIWGDTVNVASRIKDKSEQNKINIGESTFRLIKNQFECTPRGKINIKGKGAINMYFVDTTINKSETLN